MIGLIVQRVDVKNITGNLTFDRRIRGQAGLYCLCKEVLAKQERKGRNMEKVLVAYATMSGSTQEIAEFIGEELTGAGLQVELRACRSVQKLDGYTAIVLGAPIYMFHLHKDALRFLHRHQQALERCAVAVFAGGAFGENAQKDASEVQKSLELELAKFAWLHPVSVQLVGGRFDPARLRFPYNLLPALKNAPASDARDWNEIRGWARELAGRLGHAARMTGEERSQA
jgi:menaquinone-dependent protoporphyrinogen oxidase